jgi:hypothetical protein
VISGAEVIVAEMILPVSILVLLGWLKWLKAIGQRLQAIADYNERTRIAIDEIHMRLRSFDQRLLVERPGKHAHVEVS